MSQPNLSGQAAIVGLGATEFSKNSGRTELRLAMEATLAALEDAGIDPKEVDGFSSYTLDKVPEFEIARLLGCEQVRFFSQIPHGGGAACGPIMHAAMAVATGVAKTVVVYRAMNERSWYRFGNGSYGFGNTPIFENVNYGWYMPHGLHTPASWIGMFAQRYMHTYGATSEDFGRVAVAARDFAATNPNAFFYGKPITLEEHQASRWICEPLHLLDCCQESDGAVAMVITSAERARDLKQKPVIIKGASQGMAPGQQSMTSFYRDDITGLPEMEVVARELYRQAGVGPDAIQTAVIYDHFTPFVLPQLEAFGFAPKGEAKEFVRAGHHARGGKLPINTHGGQIGEAYIHGMNGVAEGVRQVRGSAANQVDSVEHVLVTAGTGVPTSGLILGVA
ncbi:MULTISPECIES: lipid-transfer protein [Stutzerimonas stutzeri group]|uniref:lipid-transfer protein n=1 Tax=Stutzerimonas stutzeri group TaxID=136846 RepID=UPI00147E08B2|nr:MULTISPECIES: lipid-transfer protein [Stutzerimonas stutzeri group]MCD1638170.1 lipid-transfer protein [Stutzerimonas stutzeri]WRQ05003.1 lipid-transfer protein [Stutzerimonas stutzeri]WRW29068.1 lipid-transfer protein [Stutzerimonas frequens]